MEYRVSKGVSDTMQKRDDGNFLARREARKKNPQSERPTTYSSIAASNPYLPPSDEDAETAPTVFQTPVTSYGGVLASSAAPQLRKEPPPRLNIEAIPKFNHRGSSLNRQGFDAAQQSGSGIPLVPILDPSGRSHKGIATVGENGNWITWNRLPNGESRWYDTEVRAAPNYDPRSICPEVHNEIIKLCKTKDSNEDTIKVLYALMHHIMLHSHGVRSRVVGHQLELHRPRRQRGPKYVIVDELGSPTSRRHGHVRDTSLGKSDLQEGIQGKAHATSSAPEPSLTAQAGPSSLMHQVSAPSAPRSFPQVQFQQPVLWHQQAANPMPLATATYVPGDRGVRALVPEPLYAPKYEPQSIPAHEHQGSRVYASQSSQKQNTGAVPVPAFEYLATSYARAAELTKQQADESSVAHEPSRDPFENLGIEFPWSSPHISKELPSQAHGNQPSLDMLPRPLKSPPPQLSHPGSSSESLLPGEAVAGPFVSEYAPKRSASVPAESKGNSPDSKVPADPLLDLFPGILGGRNEPLLERTQSQNVREDRSKLFGPKGLVSRGNELDNPFRKGEKKSSALRKFGRLANKLFTNAANILHKEDPSPLLRKAPGVKGEAKAMHPDMRISAAGKVDTSKNKEDDSDLPTISITPGDQMWILARVEFILCLTANQYLMTQKESGRMSRKSVQQVVRGWHKSNRPQVIEFMWDFATQLELVRQNINTFVFYGYGAEDSVSRVALLNCWASLARDLTKHTFCLPDQALKKIIFDAVRLLERLGGDHDAVVEFREMKKNVDGATERAAARRARRKAKRAQSQRDVNKKLDSPVMISNRGTVKDDDDYYDDGLFEG